MKDFLQQCFDDVQSAEALSDEKRGRLAGLLGTSCRAKVHPPSMFERSFAGHVAVAKTYGPYKLSLHSGSDKFSIYPIAARLAGELVHLKTAGTSYLEALRAIGRCNPRLFREINRFAVERYPTDRASYHVSAEIARMPDAAALSDEELPGLLEDFHTREVLHVTYGSVLNEARFRARFFESLRRYEEEYTRIVEAHFDRHLSRFQRSDP
jgi:hypothetical protein